MPAIIIWLAAYTLLGVVVGVPVLASLNHVQHIAVTGVVLILIGLVTVIGIRYIPPGRQLGDALIRASRPLLVALAVVTDMTIAISIASGTTELLHDWLGFDSVIALAVVVAVVVAVVIPLYVGATRGIMGGTAGERVTGVLYSSA